MNSTEALPSLRTPHLTERHKTEPSSSKTTSLPNPIQAQDTTPPSLSIKDRIITKLDYCEARLDHYLPNYEFQKNFDKLWDVIEKKTSQPIFEAFNKWLYDNGQGQWYKQLALYLAKLPLKVAYNLMNTLFSFIKLALKIGLGVPAQAIMHPLKAPIKLVKLLVILVHNLLLPETWTKVGAGMLGSVLGQAALAANPMGLMVVGIAGALMVAGISIGTLKTVLLAQKGLRLQAASEYLKDQSLKVPEYVLTGFTMVMLLEAIHQIIRACQISSRGLQHDRDIKASKDALAKEQTQEFLDKYNYPSPDREGRWYDESVVQWKMDRALDGHFSNQDLPEARFFIQEIQTGTHTQVSTVWVHGYYDIVSGQWVNGRFATVITPVPIYEKFFGFKIPLRGWEEPPMPPLADPIRVSENVVPYIGAGTGISEVA